MEQLGVPNQDGCECACNLGSRYLRSIAVIPGGRAGSLQVETASSLRLPTTSSRKRSRTTNQSGYIIPIQTHGSSLS